MFKKKKILIIICSIAVLFSLFIIPSSAAGVSNVISYNAEQVFEKNPTLSLVSPPSNVSGVTAKKAYYAPEDRFSGDNYVCLEYDPVFSSVPGYTTSMYITIYLPESIKIKPGQTVSLKTNLQFWGMQKPDSFSIDLFNAGSGNTNFSYNGQSVVSVGGAVNKYSVEWRNNTSSTVYMGGFRYVFIYGQKNDGTDLNFNINSLTLWQQLDGFEISVFESERDSEKNADISDGNGNIDSATSAMPNHSEGLADSFGFLVSAMSHTSTDCELIFPAITIPAIPGLWSELHVTNATSFNFSQALEIMPDVLITLVRILFDIALILFCFKELYKTINEVVTNTGGID